MVDVVVVGGTLDRGSCHSTHHAYVQYATSAPTTGHEIGFALSRSERKNRCIILRRGQTI